MSDKELNTLFDRLSDSWDDRYTRSANYRRRLEIIDLALDIVGTKPLKILDFGCATGFLSQYMARRGHSVVGADISSRMLGVAINSSKELPQSQLQFLDLNHVGLESIKQRFDLIVCMNTLEYLDNPDTFFNQINGVASAGCRILVSIPNRNSVFFPMQRMIYRFNKRFLKSKYINDLLYYIPHQKNCYYIKEFDSLLNRYDFEVLRRIYYSLPIGCLPLNRSVRNQKGLGMQAVFLGQKK